MPKNFEHSAQVRSNLTKEMLDAAKGRTKDLRAISLYIDWHESDESGQEPDVSLLVSWKTECAISSDLSHIYRAARPEGVYGSEYSGEYRRIRHENARKAAARRESVAARKAREDDRLSTLRKLLTY